MPRSQRQVRVSLPAALWAALRQRAELEGLTPDEVIQRAITDELGAQTPDALSTRHRLPAAARPLIVAVFFDPQAPPAPEVIAAHRRQRHFLVLVTAASREAAEHWLGEWQADALITADAAHAALPGWRRRAISAFCRRHRIALEDCRRYGSSLT